jgi:hypothetical protein
MSTNPPSLRFPFNLTGKVHPEADQAIRYAFNGLSDLNQAIAALATKVKGNSSTITNLINNGTIGGGGGGGTITVPVSGTVNNQTGNTSYSLQQADYGALVVVDTPSPFALTLNSSVTTPFYTFIQNLGTGTITLTPTSGVVNGDSPSGSYDMLAWMLMSPSLRAANHFASTQINGVTPANHLYTQLNTGNFYWIKGDSGYPWDINIFDDQLIYLSTTEYTYATASAGKRFESLDPLIGLKGVPFAKRFMNIGDSVFSSDSRLAIYTACGVATYTNIGYVKVTLTGPYVETIPGAGSNIPANLNTIHLEYEWSLDSSYNHKSGTTKETYTFCQPYGLVRWETQPWNVGSSSYDPPTNATNYNILTAGVTGLPFSDPCGFGTDGGGGSGVVTILPSQMAVVFFVGLNWWVMAPLLAQTSEPIANEWLVSYDATTGLFTTAQPAAANLADSTVGGGPVVLDSGATVINVTLSGITRIIPLGFFVSNAAAIAGGLVVGDLYRSGSDPDVVCIVH